MGSIRKMQRAAQKKLRRPGNYLTEEEYGRLMAAAVDQVKGDYLRLMAEEVSLQMLAITSKILMEDFGKLQKKETRLETFIERYAQGVEALWSYVKI